MFVGIGRMGFMYWLECGDIKNSIRYIDWIILLLFFFYF